MYRAYDDMLVRKHLIDFDDMIVQCRELLMQREDYRRAWQNKYKYILIDEFQDINKMQFDTIKLIAGESANIFAVGDDDQSIYRFQGASLENILYFKNKFPKAESILLDTNYRSTQEIIDVANAGDDDKFTKRARPFILWGCGIALLYSALVEPFARFVATVIFGYTGTFPVVDTAVLEFVLYGLLGLGAMRSVDKRIPK
jgi:DNA helicase IV